VTTPSWAELRIDAVPRDRLGSLCERLFALGAEGLQEDFAPGTAPPPPQPWDPGPAPVPDPVFLTAWFAASLRDAVRSSLVDLPWHSTWHDTPDADWEAAYRASVTPLHVGGLVVAPPWDAPQGALVIEPGQGFGTGDHPTTVQMLHAVQTLAPDAATVLDVGCGSGILALAAARHGGTVLGIDIHVEAIFEARHNAARNRLAADFSTDRLEDLTGRWDLVLANLHAELLIALAPHLSRVGSKHWALAGILADREDAVRTAFSSLQLDHRTQIGQWVHLRYRSAT